MNSYDVIICGGGPAGSTCAITLADSGLKVAVIDKAVFPRNKVCGDAVAAYVPKVLHTIHPDYAKSLFDFREKTEVDTCRVFAPNNSYIDMRSSESGFISTRLKLDQFLYSLSAGKTNIDWYLNNEIKDIIVTGDDVTVLTNTYSFNAKMIIGCDGAHSIVSKKLSSITKDLAHYSASVRGYYSNVSDIPEKTYELHFMKGILPGYFWIFPLPGNIANVGLCIPSPIIAKNKINLRNTMQEIITAHPVIKHRFLNASLNGKIEGYELPLATRKLPVSGDRFLLCGDAAYLIDPATGEGIGQAIISGRTAGWQVIKCFEKNNFSAQFMKQYDEMLYKKLWRDAKRSQLIRRTVLEKEWLFNAGFNLLNSSKAIRRFVLRNIVKVTS